MKQIGILLCLLFSISVWGQQKRVINSCNYGIENQGAELCSYFQKSGFTSNQDAEKSIRQILEPLGLKPNFVLVPCPNIQNALAVNLDDGIRYIVYDPIFMAGIQKSAQTDWTSISILAHEVGHHLNGHTLTASSDEETRREELEADEFSGFILGKIGANLSEAQAAMKALPHPTCQNEIYSDHPCLEKRLKAIKDGWDKGAAKTTNTTQQNTNVNLPDIKDLGTFWRATSEGFWIKDRGKDIGPETTSTYLGSDVVAYHRPSGITYLLSNYVNSKDNSWRAANVLTSNHQPTWVATADQIWLIAQGRDISNEVIKTQIGWDMLAYHPMTNQTYLMANYSGSKDSRYRSAIIMPGNVVWRATNEGYHLIFNGVNISSELTAAYSGNDVISTSTRTGKKFRLPNYANRINGLWFVGSEEF